MANIFKLHKYQTFGLLKMHNLSKFWFAYNNFSLWKSLVFTLYGLSKMLFLNFCLFHFSKFQMTIIKNLMEKPSFFIMDFEGSYEVLKYLWSSVHTFNNETTALLKFFGIFTEMHFVSLFFLNERNIMTSILMIHLKCTVVHYANTNCALFKLQLLYMFILTKLLSKTFKKAIIF